MATTGHIVSFCVCNGRIVAREKKNKKQEKSTVFSLSCILSLLFSLGSYVLLLRIRNAPNHSRIHSVYAHVCQRGIVFFCFPNSHTFLFRFSWIQFLIWFRFKFKCYCVEYCFFAFGFLLFSAVLFFPLWFNFIEFKIVVQISETFHEQQHWCETCKSNSTR